MFQLEKTFFCENQPIFVGRLPIDFFYFEDFRWSIFGKITGQKPLLSLGWFYKLALLDFELIFEVKMQESEGV